MSAMTRHARDAWLPRPPVPAWYSSEGLAVKGELDEQVHDE